MNNLEATRRRVVEARSDTDRQAALVSLSSALYEYDAAEAVTVAEEAIELAIFLNDAVGAAWARHNRAWAFAASGRMEDALAEQLEVLAVFEELQDERGIAHTLMSVGDIHSDSGDTATALEYLERALNLMESVGDQAGKGAALNLMAIALSHEGRHREAILIFEQAEDLYTALGDSVHIITAQVNRGFELLSLHELEPQPALVAEAEALAAAAVEQGLSLGDDGRSTVAYGRSLLALAYAASGSRGQALVEAGEAEAVARAGGFEQQAVEIALDRVGWLIDDNRIEEARVVLRRFETDAGTILSRRATARSHELRAGILEAMGDHAGALAAFREFHRINAELHDSTAERRARLTAVRFEVERARQEALLARQRVAELEALDHDKRDFLASVSHELRTPLAAVLGFATELSESWEVFDAEEARGLVALIAKQSADIAAIVEDLLTVTRMEAGTMAVYPEPIEVAEAAAEMVSAMARGSGREVAWNGSGMVWADPNRLRQIIRNLISNAFRHGGSEVRVTIRPGPGSPTQIEVRDSGGPIPSERIETMFEPFVHSIDHARTPNSVGLGLAVARSLARMMHGDLVYAYEGNESVFRLELPARQPG
jgi:signal transduction histidine kinase